jgi:SAM-dependent methyltransferase
MAADEWLKRMFDYGYDSGDVLSEQPDERRAHEELAAGGCYHRIYREAIVPFLTPASSVLEIGPGKGSWTRAILHAIPHGVLHTVDFIDVTEWLQPERHEPRLVCHTVDDTTFDCVPDGTFDFCWSFGVFCHHGLRQIETILRNTRPKMKRNGLAVHQYGDWDKLEAQGWTNPSIPPSIRTLPDDESWWPRNSSREMSAAAVRAGWTVVSPDLGLMDRDSIAVFAA